MQTSALLLFTSYHDQRKNNWHFHCHAHIDTGYCRQSNNTRYNLLGLSDSRCIERDDSISGLVKAFTSVSFRSVLLEPLGQEFLLHYTVQYHRVPVHRLSVMTNLRLGLANLNQMIVSTFNTSQCNRASCLLATSK